MEGINPRLMPRRPCVTVDALRRWRLLWQPAPGGFTVPLLLRLRDGREIGETVQVSARPIFLCGFAFTLVCPDCGRRVRTLYATATPRLSCRRCAGLRYVAASLHDSWKLNAHFFDLKAACDHRPGRKPNRYWRDLANVVFHEERALRHFCRSVDRIGARSRRRARRGRT
jgi:hypothetical protein